METGAVERSGYRVALEVVAPEALRGGRLTLEAGIHRVGSAPDAEVHLALDSVAPRHAVLEVLPDGGVVITDLGAPGGTCLADRPIAKAAICAPATISFGAVRVFLDPAPVPEDDGASTTAALPPLERPGFTIELLGHPRVCWLDAEGGEQELHWRLRRAFEVVVFLALAPQQRASRDELVDALWPDASQQAVRRNFHPTVSDARRTLLQAGDLQVSPILFRQGLYTLHPDVVWHIDVVRFEEGCRAGEVLCEQGDEHRAAALERWRAAWRLYRGHLMAGSYAPWVAESHREGLRRRFLALLREVGELAGELGHHTLSLDAYRTLLIEEPFEEKIHVAVMELYAHQGRRDLVRRQFLRLQELLEELNVAPLPTTQDRYHELMR